VWLKCTIAKLIKKKENKTGMFIKAVKTLHSVIFAKLRKNKSLKRIRKCGNVFFTTHTSTTMNGKYFGPFQGAKKLHLGKNYVFTFI
jgi:hypothetical protein